MDLIAAKDDFTSREFDEKAEILGNIANELRKAIGDDLTEILEKFNIT